MIEQLMNDCAKLGKAIEYSNEVCLELRPDRSPKFKVIFAGYSGGGDCAETALKQLKEKLTAQIEHRISENLKYFRERQEQQQALTSILNEVESNNVQQISP